jgi:hypothetical protein
MSTRDTRSTLALAVLLAGALALPGFAAADGDWGDRGHGERHHERDGGHGGEWRGERRHEGGDRGWHERHHHDHWRDHEAHERPVYRHPHRPLLPGLSVFLNGSW